jgi:uncharacterized MnhB-related membrane protein
LWYISQLEQEYFYLEVDMSWSFLSRLQADEWRVLIMESVIYGLFLAGAIFFAYRAIISKKILSATIYLACISALVSAVLYMLGAAQVAVMELSVGAGLVTVLLVYAVSVVGDDALRSSRSRSPLGWWGWSRSCWDGWLSRPFPPISSEGR